eukprot:1418277-Amphidinium_carterae.1
MDIEEEEVGKLTLAKHINTGTSMHMLACKEVASAHQTALTFAQPCWGKLDQYGRPYRTLPDLLAFHSCLVMRGNGQADLCETTAHLA